MKKQLEIFHEEGHLGTEERFLFDLYLREACFPNRTLYIIKPLDAR